MPHLLHSGTGPERGTEKEWLEKQEQTSLPEFCQTTGQLIKESRYYIARYNEYAVWIVSVIYGENHQ